MKKPASIAIIILMLCLLPLRLQAKVVKLITTGEGATKEQATNAALQSALAQAFGTFVSANTAILNDELVRDEIAKLTTGNIESYKEISCIKTDKYTITLESRVSIEKLINYARVLGNSAEFASQTFLTNMRMRELNKKNEKEALSNLITMLKSQRNHLLTGNIKVKDPKKTERGYTVPITLKVFTTENFATLYDLILKTLSSLSLNAYEIADYDRNDEPYTLLSKSNNLYEEGLKFKELKPDDFFYLRGSEEDIKQFLSEFCDVMNQAYWNVKVQDVSGNDRTVGPSPSYQLFRYDKPNPGFNSFKDMKRKTFFRFGIHEEKMLGGKDIPRDTHWNCITTQEVKFDYTPGELSNITGFQIADMD